MTAPMPEQTGDDADRRIAPRLRTLKRAKILFNNRYSTFDCILRNISATGALLTIDPAAHIPKTFEIRIGDEGAIRPAMLVYRRELFAGIRFLDIEEESAQSAMRHSEAPGAVSATASVAPATEDRIAPSPAGGITRIVGEDLPAPLLSRLPWQGFVR